MDTCVDCGSEANFICDCSVLICETHMGTHLKIGDEHSVKSFRGNIIKKNALSKIQGQLKVLDQCSLRVVQDLNAFIQEATNLARNSLKYIQEIRLELLNQLQLIKKMMSPEELNRLQNISEKVFLGQNHSFSPIAIVISKDDWDCSGCGGTNKLDWNICQKCNNLKPGVEGWVCKLCTFLNQNTRGKECESCFVIDRENPNPIMEDNWKCISCESFNVGSRKFCSQCHNINPIYDTASKEPAKVTVNSQEDWDCSGCGTTNYYFRDKCKKCNTNKGKKTEVVVKTGPDEDTCKCKCPKVNSKYSNFCMKCYETKEEAKNKKPDVPEEAKYKKPEVARKSEIDNEWTCKRCSEVNSNILNYCASCYEKKPTELKPTQPISQQANDDWTCRLCTFKNYSLANYFESCLTSKKEPEYKKQSSWICPKCQSPNALSSKTCDYCKSPSPGSKAPDSLPSLTNATTVSKINVPVEVEKLRPIICPACGEECKVVDCPRCLKTQRPSKKCTNCTIPLKDILKCSKCNTPFSTEKRTPKRCRKCSKKNIYSATKCVRCSSFLR